VAHHTRKKIGERGNKEGGTIRIKFGKVGTGSNGEATVKGLRKGSLGEHGKGRRGGRMKQIGTSTYNKKGEDHPDSD